MEYVINNNTSYDLTQLEKLARQFLPFAQKRMGFNRPPTINFASDEENCANPLGKTGQYDPSRMEITILVDKRHIKDILRSLSHELVHHNQNCRGDFNREFSTAPGYAQDDEFLRNMEDEAYREGNFCLRDWEDGIKTSKIKNIQLNETIYKRTVSAGDNSMSTKDWKDKELNSLLMEKWGYTLKEDLTPYMDEKDYSTGQKGSLEDGEAELREEEDDDEREVELESQLSEEHPHSPDQREVKKKINNESVSRDKSLSRKDKSVLFEQEEEEEVEEEKAVDVEKVKKSKKEDKELNIKSSLDMAKSIIKNVEGQESDEEVELKATSPKRKLDILNQLVAGKGPVVSEFEKYISGALKQAYLDRGEDINTKQVDFLTKDALKTFQATASKAKKALVDAGKKSRESKAKIKKSLSESLAPSHDILLYEFRQQKLHRKRAAFVNQALTLLDEGGDKNFLPAIALLNEGVLDFAARPVVAGLSKAATNKMVARLMQKMVQRGGFGSKIASQALQKTPQWITFPPNATRNKIIQMTQGRKSVLQQQALLRGMPKAQAMSASNRQLVRYIDKINKNPAMRSTLRKRAQRVAAEKAKQKAAAAAAAKEAGKQSAKEAPKGFWRNLVRGNIGRALKEFCKNNKTLCVGLGIYAALEVIGNVADFGDTESEEQRLERQHLLDAMSDAQLRELCKKGNKHACIELEVRRQDREAGALPDTPDSGIGGDEDLDKSFMVSNAPKPQGSFLGMSISWLEGRGWRWNGVDFAKPKRPNYWLSRNHCKGVKYCKGWNKGRGRKKVKVTKSSPMMSKDVAETGVGGAEFGPGTSGMSPITLTNPKTGEVEGLTRAGQKAMEVPLPPDVLKAREEYERSLKENK